MFLRTVHDVKFRELQTQLQNAENLSFFEYEHVVCFFTGALELCWFCTVRKGPKKGPQKKIRELNHEQRGLVGGKLTASQRN